MSAGEIARIVWALATATFGALWLARSSPPSSQSSRWVKLPILLCLAFSVGWSLVWLTLAWHHCTYPYELEWIGGAMKDHVERFLNHQPLYVQPGGGWFPYEYPPFYPWLCAQIVGFTKLPIFIAMRGVSILSTIGCAVIVAAWICRTAPQSPKRHQWALVAVGLFLAAYRVTGDWYDLERLDMLFLFLSLLGIFLLGEGLLYTFLAALALLLAFFTKQQALLFMLAGCIVLWRLKQYRQLALFLSTLLIIGPAAVLLLNRASHSWFWYYCFHIPLYNGIRWRLALLFLYNDLTLYAPLLVVLFFNWRAVEGMKPNGRFLLMWMGLAAFLGSWLSRAHWGGDQNVLIPVYLFLSVGACAVGGNLTEHALRQKIATWWLILAQFFAIAYRPTAQLPSDASLAAGERFTKEIHQWEKQGEVLCLDHGGFTTPAHFQIMGLLDVMNAEHRLPTGLITALRTHRYAAIVTDGLPGNQDTFGKLLYTYYHPILKENYPHPWVVTGFLTPNPTHPVYIWIAKVDAEKNSPF